MTGSATEIAEIETTVGLARAHHYAVEVGVARATLVLGHGAGKGVDSFDLLTLAQSLPAKGIEIVLVEQPWVLAGKKVAPAPQKIDAAFREVVLDIRRSGQAMRHLVIGGRSAGARSACRVAESVKADGVVALAFPLHRPGHAEPNRSDELVTASRAAPMVVIQGERDAFGTPVELASVMAQAEIYHPVVSIPWADHSFATPAKATVTQDEVGGLLADSVHRAILHHGNGISFL